MKKFYLSLVASTGVGVIAGITVAQESHWLAAFWIGILAANVSLRNLLD